MPVINGNYGNYRPNAGASEELSELSPKFSNYYSGIDWAGILVRLLENIHWILLVGVVGAAILGVREYFYVKPVYQATSKIYIAGSESLITLSDLSLSNSLTGDFLEVFKNKEMHELVRESSGLGYSADTLSGMVSIKNPSNTHVLYITVKAPNRSDAKLLADTYAEVVREFIAATMDVREPNLFESAHTPGKAINIDVKKKVVTGFAGGAGAMCAIFMFIFLIDDRIRSADDIAKVCNLPTLGMLPMQDMKANAAKATPGALYVLMDEDQKEKHEAP